MKMRSLVRIGNFKPVRRRKAKKRDERLSTKKDLQKHYSGAK